MHPQARRYRIVVALDDSEYAGIVLEHALDQAVRHDACDLHFARIVGAKRDIESASQQIARVAAEAYETYLHAPGDRRSRLHIRAGDTVEELARLAADVDADLLVIGRFGTHSRKGSLAGSIVDASPCPVLAVGLTERVVAVEQCPACVAVREATEAEALFCSDHAGDPRMHSSALLSWTSGTFHGRMW
jgi:nucleotide-binding universal stress UspA family protein